MLLPKRRPPYAAVDGVAWEDLASLSLSSTSGLKR
jgi:hypothetical protein